MILNDQKTNLILDFGAQKKHLEKNFLTNKINPKNTAAILITHAHYDHSVLLFDKIAKNYKIFATKGTWTELNFKKQNLKSLDKNEITFDRWIKISNSNWKFKAIKTKHNALDPACFIIKNKFKKILYLTDTEYFENPKFKGMHGYLIECNYGLSDSLSNQQVKKHFLKIQNHMNSTDVEKFYQKYRKNKTKLFLLTHLSSKNDDNYEILNSFINKYQNQKTSIYKVKPNDINTFKTEI